MNIKELIAYRIIKNFVDQAMRSKTDHEQRYKVNQKSIKNLQASNDSFTSVARIAAQDQVCGCFYRDRNNKVWFSTNYASTEEMIRSSKNTNRKDRFEQFIHPLIKKFIERQFTSESKDKLAKALVCYFIKDKVRWNRNFFKAKADLLNKKIIMILRHDIDNFEELLELNELIERFLEDNRKEQKVTEKYLFLTEIKILFRDIIEICTIDKSETLINLLRNNLVRASCYGEKGVHCECRMLEHITRIVDSCILSEKSLEELFSSVKENRFTVSKLCCQLCYEVFRQCEKVYSKDKNWENIIYLKLGNSAVTFPGWTSPNFENLKGLFLEIKEIIEESLGSATSWEEERFIIENSPDSVYINESNR